MRTGGRGHYPIAPNCSYTPRLTFCQPFLRVAKVLPHFGTCIMHILCIDYAMLWDSKVHLVRPALKLITLCSPMQAPSPQHRWRERCRFFFALPCRPARPPAVRRPSYGRAPGAPKNVVIATQRSGACSPTVPLCSPHPHTMGAARHTRISQLF